MVDLRPHRDYAAGHLPGAYSIPAGSSFGTWLGWVVPADRPLVLVLGGTADWDDALRQALRIGYDDVRGYLTSVADWRAAELPLETAGGRVWRTWGGLPAARGGRRCCSMSASATSTCAAMSRARCT